MMKTPLYIAPIGKRKLQRFSVVALAAILMSHILSLPATASGASKAQAPQVSQASQVPQAPQAANSTTPQITTTDGAPKRYPLLSAAAGNTSSASQIGSSTDLNAGVVKSLEPTRTLSLYTCFDASDKFNQEITSAKWNLPILKAAIIAAGAIPNPQFQLQAGFGDSFNYLFTGQTQQYGLVQQFQTAGKRTKKIEVARANYGLSELQLDALRFNVHNRVRRAYAELAAAEAYEALIEAQRTVGLKLSSIAQRRYDAGKAAYSEVSQALLNVLQYDTQRNSAQGRLEQASAALTQLVGERPNQVEVIDVDDNGIFKLSAEKTDIVPSPTKAPPQLDKLLLFAQDSRPDLKVAVQQAFVNRRALVLIQTKKIPDVFFGIGGTYSTFAKSQPPGLNSTANWIGTGIFTSLTCETPVFYQYHGEVAQARATLRQSERQVDLQRAQVAADVATAYSSVLVTRANIIEFQNNLLPTASRVASIARRGYEVGATDLASAIVAQQQYQQILSNYFDSVVAYQIAWADLEKAVGLPLK
jgi:cobalt-zinc-cadmium efflux system outer membrane protein